MSDEKKQLLSKMITDAMEAERQIARREAQKDLDGVENMFPDDHPIRKEIDRVKTAVGGDLSLLPERHPLRLAIKRFADQISGTGASGSPEQTVVKKKVARKKHQDDRREEDDRAAKWKADFKNAAAGVNKQIEGSAVALDKLIASLEEGERVFKDDRLANMRAARLYRGAAALRRLLDESRIMGVRA